MANHAENRANGNTQSANVPSGTRQDTVSAGDKTVPLAAGFSLGALKIIEKSGSNRALASDTGVPKSVIHRIRTEPGYQPSEPNQAKLVAAWLVELNDFRRWPEDAAEVADDAPPDEAETETDLAYVYGAKVRRSQIRTALRELEPRLTEVELVLGSPEYENFHGFVLKSVESFQHPDAPSASDSVEDEIIDRHIAARDPDCCYRSADVLGAVAAARRGERPMPECCARGFAELRAYNQSAAGIAWQSNYEASLRSHEPATTDFALALVRSLLPAPRLDGPMRANLGLVSDFKALVLELEQRIEKLPQRTRVHLQAAQLLESLHSEQVRLDKSVDVKSLSAWSNMVQRFCDGLAPHESLRQYLITAFENRNLLHFDMLASFDFDAMPNRAAMSKADRRAWIAKRRSEMQRSESARQ